MNEKSMKIERCSNITLHNIKSINDDEICIWCKKTVREIKCDQK